MSCDSDRYADFVEHPRYGRGPRITGLNPQPHERGVNLHWNAITHDEIAAQWEAAMDQPFPYGPSTSDLNRTRRIAHTAIRADLARQAPATVAVTHYFDLERRCRDCNQPFIFFAAEQKYWYEELGFGLDSDCVRCVNCRKKQQGLSRDRETYETLFQVAEKTIEQSLDMADACLSLIEAGVFSTKQTQRVRSLLNTVPDNAHDQERSRCAELKERVLAIEKS
jgi:hypothetical protein